MQDHTPVCRKRFLLALLFFTIAAAGLSFGQSVPCGGSPPPPPPFECEYQTDVTCALGAIAEWNSKIQAALDQGCLEWKRAQVEFLLQELLCYDELPPGSYELSLCLGDAAKWLSQQLTAISARVDAAIAQAEANFPDCCIDPPFAPARAMWRAFDNQPTPPPCDQIGTIPEPPDIECPPSGGPWEVSVTCALARRAEFTAKVEAAFARDCAALVEFWGLAQMAYEQCGETFDSTVIACQFSMDPALCSWEAYLEWKVCTDAVQATLDQAVKELAGDFAASVAQATAEFNCEDCCEEVER